MNESLSLLAALTAGLLGGVHCVGMCGGIVGALSLAMPGQKQGPKLTILLGYNTGRITSYVAAGALVGGIGQLSLGFMHIQSLQLVLAVIAGFMMILMGFYLGGWNGFLRHVEKAGGLVWKRIEPAGRKLLPVRNPEQAYLLGLVWGWLPCGLVYSMLIWALGSGGPVDGAMLMLAFGIGTLPNLLATGLLAGQFVRRMQQPRVRMAAGVLLILFGIYTLYRGFI
jgi:sulfite exporter TauE/SafE